MAELMGILKVGNSFGESSMLKGAPYEATVKASGPASALVLKRESYELLCGQNSALPMEMPLLGGMSMEETDEAEPSEQVSGRRSHRRESVFVEVVEVDDSWVPPSYPHTAEEEAKLRVYVGKAVLLCHLDSLSRDSLVAALQKKEFAKDQEIITQGAEGDFYYILDSGKADVWKTDKAGTTKKVNEYGPGGAFGELALLHGEPRFATVRATEDCVVWALDRTTFRMVMQSTAMSSLSERLRLLDKVALLKDLTPYERCQIAEALETREYKDGEVLAAQGADGAELFILRKGRCECFKS